MAKFAPVVPIDIAKDMKDEDCLGDYHLLLAHDVVKHPEEYARVYNDIGQTVIMDNSVIELKRPVDVDMIAAAVETVHAGVVVLQDELLQREKTLETVQSSRNALGSKLPPRTQYMAVPQGESIEDWVRCCEDLAELPQGTFQWIGIPRNFVEKLHGTRVLAVSIVDALMPDKHIHLLGFSDDLNDDVYSCKFGSMATPMLMGIDSAVPIRLGTQGEKLRLSRNKHSPRGNWWDEHPHYNNTVYENVEKFRKWIKFNG